MSSKAPAQGNLSGPPKVWQYQPPAYPNKTRISTLKVLVLLTFVIWGVIALVAFLYKPADVGED
jgi:hypothetical protein